MAAGFLKKTSRNGYTYYGCEYNGNKLGRACDFMTWDVPVKETCPECGWTMFKKSGRGFKKPFCINEACPAFVPEEKRGGFRRKKTETAEAAAPAEGTAAETAPTEGGGRCQAGGQENHCQEGSGKGHHQENRRRSESRRGQEAGGQKTATKKTTKKAAAKKAAAAEEAAPAPGLEEEHG